MKKVYICTQGDYSDYHIVAVFSNEQDARDYGGLYGYVDVEEYDLDLGVDMFRKGYSVYSVLMLKDGNLCVNSFWHKGGLRKNNTSDIENLGTRYYDVNTLQHTCWAKDEQHAIKITNEIRAQIIATVGWGNLLPKHETSIENK